MPNHSYSFGRRHRKVFAPISKSRLPYPPIAGSGSNTGSEHFKRAKAEADTKGSNLWRVYNKLYDLTDYLDKHPGGRDWLELTRGTDCTEAFEAHHLDTDKVENVLKSFFIRDADDGGLTEELNKFSLKSKDKQKDHVQHPSSRIFTYGQQDFWKTLKRRVRSKLMEHTGAKTIMEATAPSRAMKIASFICILQFLIFHEVAAKTGKKLISVLAGLSLIGCWGVGHNFMHQSAKTAWLWQFAIDLTPLSSFQQRITHALSHHLYPNLHCDVECYESEAIHPYLPAINKHGGFVAKSKIGHFFFWHFLGVLLTFVKTTWFIAAFKRKYLKISAGEIAYLLPIFQLFNYIRRNGIIHGFKLYLIQMGAFFTIFIPIGLGVHHAAAPDSTDKNEYNTLAWHEGQPNAQTDWGRHQVASTSDHSVSTNNGSILGCYLSLSLWGFLNDHVAHHFFPVIDHSKHSIYRKVMRETFAEFNIKYKEHSPYDLLNGYFTFNKKRSVSQLVKDAQNIG